MPLLILGFFALQFDRGNIGNALTDHFLKDVGIKQNQFNVGQQLLSVGIVLLEIPSNIILYRVGPRVWITGQIFCWGLVATFQAFQKGLGAFLVTRLLLGFCESGFIPASLYTMTTWYKRDETSARFGAFFIGNFAAQATSGLIAYGVLHMRGVCNLAGWQWLFIIEGLFTITVSFILMAFLPKNPFDPVPFTRIQYFSQREKDIIRRRVFLDDPTKEKKSKNITRAELLDTLGDWKLYPHVLMTIAGLAPSNTMTSYAPTLVTSFGYGRLKSNAITSIGMWILTVLAVLWGVMADKFHRRGPLVFGGIVPWAAFAIGSVIGSYHPKQKKARLATLLLGIGFSNVWHPCNASWVALNAKTPGERSIRMAMMIMGANAGGIIGSQLFQSSDAPLYHTGWAAIAGIICFGVLMAIVCNVQYWVLNRRIDKGLATGLVTGEAAAEVAQGAVVGEKFRYRL
ncbi:MFS general substrate transporter [Mytilinidion resinicola]|uniref:MFS general substrate transporter n=1 Tax=Mytilinidion resinicola TaxID=574789 RepID=A0A6A6Z5F0_9PEZI|nr:MFS general substrate transporter [Mytilinidion resinicola]KAF2815415.1 MFS general substrate transporter [Mytilinidion resinicola]